ncbi:multiple organellar RNA editing factor 1, mitochondrial-like isoform X2 [Canna indica]|uniref:Multiple organellar RNA editing factor 1, mitochondrial-like isoform X2 n=1 Tax=Canna indica TaxID=4628 RepID=A0AAQ3JWC7_9LILI|nr:multiple organellar RNA editing factor 1, mitochondrial-like isoform X2 [Canna indica]
MVLHLRFRRAATLSSSFLKGRSFSPAVASASSPLLPLSYLSAAADASSYPLRPYSLSEALSFRSSAPLSDRRSDGGEEKKFGPDDILFEGCDFNHWLITIGLPQGPCAHA